MPHPLQDRILATRTRSVAALGELLGAAVWTSGDEHIVALVEDDTCPLGAFIDSVDAVVEAVGELSDLITELVEISSFTADSVITDAGLLEKKREARRLGVRRLAAGGTWEDLTEEHQALFIYLLALEAALGAKASA